MKNITPTLPSPLRGGGLGWGGQRAPEVNSCDHRKNRYGPLNIGAATNFRKIFLQLLSSLSGPPKKFSMFKTYIESGCTPSFGIIRPLKHPLI